MSAKLRAILLAIALSIYEVSALSLTEPRCRCLKVTSNYIAPRHFSHIEIIPKSAYCSKAEIIIISRHKTTICLDPGAKWVKKYVSAIISQVEENVTRGTE
ncbi:interleukin-8 [Erpetoichthys calabaricus]|uniref:interleukin-8 n=1 Tax=Erpetoichthys calabaricus TaxID=27687 RepID=UPI002234460D|nr:interleukin-8 [Erpetoichthys calabaricus]